LPVGAPYPHAYPYPARALFSYMAAPTYALPAGHTNIEALTDLEKLPLYFASDITIGVTSMYADYLFPDLHYLAAGHRHPRQRRHVGRPAPQEHVLHRQGWRQRLLLRHQGEAGPGVAEGETIPLTERRDHLEHFATALRKVARHVVVLQGGTTVKERRKIAAQLAAIPDTEERIVLATGRYIGQGFDDARLDALFLALPR
jgi:anaerobic selenocysteine-containing dehydrogenase